MKKIFLLFSLLLGVLSAWAYDVKLDGIFYNLDKENKTASVASYSYYKGAVVIPDTISVDGKAYTVTSLGENCFSGCWGLTSITIPNSVTRIGDYCFSSCDGLESIVVESGNTVYDSRENCNAIIETATNTMLSGCRNTTIPNSVTSLGDGCFLGCSGLTSITIPNSVTSLGDYCFSGCSGLTSITIPSSVTSLGEYCFLGCSGLTSITIPSSVTSLGNKCFWGCSGLTSITIPNSVTRMGENCFTSCGGLESIVVESGNTVYDSRENCNAIIETATNTMLSGCRNTTIPNSVISLGDGCFLGCSGLTSITIPNSVTSLGVSCFYVCSGLTSITIPNSVTRMGEYCFTFCGGLESIVVESGNTVYDSRENCNAIIETATNTMLSGCRNTTIPNSVTSLGGYCFWGCSGLTSITIPNSVTSLGNECFSGCSGLTSITIPNSVTSLGRYCFYGCSGLTEVHANRETPPATGSGIFEACYSLQTIYVPTGSSANYAINPWNAYKIVEEDVLSGITAVTVKGETVAPVYHLNGSRAGTTKSFSTQPKGIYIVNGKKVLR